MRTAVVLPLFAGWALLSTAVVPAARACRYCQQAADPVEVMRFQGQNRNAGSFPLDDSLNSYASGAPAAPVPSPAPVITSAAELPARPVAAVPVVVAAAPPAPAPVQPVPAAVTTVTSARPPQSVSVRWADIGLLGLAGVGGWFAWRTRAGRPVAA